MSDENLNDDINDDGEEIEDSDTLTTDAVLEIRGSAEAEEILILNVVDPLTDSSLTVTDISTARFALKNASNSYFAIIHMDAQKRKELARSAAENYAQKLKILDPYLPTVVDSHGFAQKIRYIPDPLPSRTPQNVRDAMAMLDAQLATETERAEADFNEDAVPLRKTLNEMKEKVQAWFKAECQAEADWLGGANTAVLSGCTVTWNGGDSFNFKFVEQSYD